jgi:hypothetical protein
MQFTRISKLTFTLSDSLCSKVPGSFRFLTYVPLLGGKALKKNGGFAMGPLGAGRRRSGQIPANRRPGPAGRGRGRVLGSVGTDSRARSGRGGGRQGAAPAARPSDRGGRPVPARAAREGRVSGRRALVDAREGREGLGSVHIRPEVVARRDGSGGGHGWSAGARLGAMQGAVPLLWATRDRRRRP